MDVEGAPVAKAMAEDGEHQASIILLIALVRPANLNT